MRRHLFNIASVVSLLLCSSTLSFWIRSYWYSDSLSHTRYWIERKMKPETGVVAPLTRLIAERHFNSQQFDSKRGEMQLSWCRGFDDEQPLIHSVEWLWWNGVGYYEDTPQTTLHLPPSVIIHRIRRSDGNLDVWNVVFPAWLVVGISVVAPLVVAVRVLRRRKRLRCGDCEHCGYNLTGNTSGTCPECGTPVPASKGEIPRPE